MEAYPSGNKPTKLKVKKYRLDGNRLPQNIQQYFDNFGENNPYASVYDNRVLVLEDNGMTTAGTKKKELSSSAVPRNSQNAVTGDYPSSSSNYEEPSSSARPSTEKTVASSYPSGSSVISIADLLSLVNSEYRKYIPKKRKSIDKFSIDDSETVDTEGTDWIRHELEQINDEHNGIGALKKKAVKAVNKKSVGKESYSLESEAYFTYDSLISKPDMYLPEFTIPYSYNNSSKPPRMVVVKAALSNARFKSNPKNTKESVFVRNNDTGNDILINRKGIEHGLYRKYEKNAVAYANIGDIIENAILINEHSAREGGAEGNIYLGAGRYGNELYLCRIITNEENSVEDLEVMYALNTKKESVAHYRLGIAAKPLSNTNSTVSIADFLEIVKTHFADVLPEDVLRQMSMTRPKSSVSDSVKYSIDDSETVDTEGTDLVKHDLEQMQLERTFEEDSIDNRKEKNPKTKPVAVSRPLDSKKSFKKDLFSIFSIPKDRRKELGTLIDRFAEDFLKKRSISESDIAIAERLSKALDRDILFFSEDARNGNIKNGVFDRDTIWINVKHDSERTIPWIIAHELTHTIEATKAYDALKDYVFDILGEEAVNKQRKELLEMYDRNEIDYEIVSNYVADHLLKDEAAIMKLVRKNRSLGQKIKSILANILDKIGVGGKKTEEYLALERVYKTYQRALAEQANAQNTDGAASEVERAKEKAIDPDDILKDDYIKDLREQFTRGEITQAEFNRLVDEYVDGETITNEKPKFSKTSNATVGDNFRKLIDKWDKNTIGFSFVVGETSTPLQKAGMPKKQIRWDASKIRTLLNKHSGMSIDVVKKVPELLEHPIIIIDSKQNENSKIVMGDLYDDNGKIVTAVLLLTPTSKKGNVLDLIKISSAEGRGHISSLFTKEDGSNVTVRYVDKKRIQSWLNVNRLQLPLHNLNSDSDNSIPNSDGKVNTSGENNFPFSKKAQKSVSGTSDTLTEFAEKTRSQYLEVTENLNPKSREYLERREREFVRRIGDILHLSPDTKRGIVRDVARGIVAEQIKNGAVTEDVAKIPMPLLLLLFPILHFSIFFSNNG